MKANSILLKAAAGLIPGVALFICLFADRPSSLLFRSASAANKGAANKGAVKTGARGRQIRLAPREDGFVIDDLQGRVACRDATPEESLSMNRRDPAERLRVITPLTQDLQQQQAGMKIILRGTSQLDGFPAAKDAFIRAAAKWEAIIQDPITVIIDVDFGPMRFGQPFGGNTIGSTRSQSLGDDMLYPDLRSGLISGASRAAETTLYNSLPNGTVPTDIGSTASIVGTSANFRALGFLNPTANPDAEPFGAPPSIGFNSAFNFDFDPSDGVGSNMIDFDGTAVHELGHVLGFVSLVGAKELDSTQDVSLAVWDLFRFRSGVNISTFSTAQRILSSGGDQIFFDGGNELGLSTGRPNGQGGDNRQASHWKADELTGLYIGIMDPSAGRGMRDLLTDNDLRVIDALGYELRTVTNQPGTAPVIVAPASIDFGVVPASTAVNRLLTLRNTGTAVLNVTNINSLASNFSVNSITNTFAIAPGGQETVAVRLIPTSGGTPSGAISITCNDPAHGMVSIPIKATIGAATLTLSTVSAASFSGPMVASDSIGAGFGQNLATSTQQAPSLPLPLSLGGTTIRVRDSAGTQRDAPLFFASLGQVNYQIPTGTENGVATVTLISGAGVVSGGSITVVPVAPGLFAANPTGQGVAAAVVLRVRADNSQSFEPVARFDAGRFVSVPIDLSNSSDQVFLLLFGTGIRSRTSLSGVSVSIGGVAGEVSYAGPQGLVSLDQVNVRVPSSLAGRGEVDLMLKADNVNSNIIKVNFK